MRPIHVMGRFFIFIIYDIYCKMIMRINQLIINKYRSYPQKLILLPTELNKIDTLQLIIYELTRISR